MRQLTLSARAPQAVGKTVRGSKSFDSSHSWQSEIKPKRKLSRAEIRTLEQAKRIEEQRLIDLKATSKQRDYEHWVFAAKTSRHEVTSFTNELLAIKYQVKQIALGKPCFLNDAVEDLGCTSKALGQFVRHFFGSDMGLRWFCEWMYGCPDLHDGTVPGFSREVRGLPFEKLSYRQQAKLRARLRLYLHVIFKNCLSEALDKKLGRGNGDQLELFITNKVTHKRCCAIVDLDSYKVVAFYLEKEMNRKRGYRRARQLDHRLKRFH